MKISWALFVACAFGRSGAEKQTGSWLSHVTECSRTAPDLDTELLLSLMEMRGNVGLALGCIHHLRGGESEGFPASGAARTDCLLRSILSTQESPGYLHDLANQGVDALFVFDVSWRILDVNNAACETLGYNRQQLMQMSVWDIEQEDLFLWTSSFWEEVQTGEGKTVSGVHRNSDGIDRRVAVRLSGFKSGGQRLVCAIAAAVRDEPEVAVGTASESPWLLEFDLFRELFDSSSEAVAVIDRNGFYLQQNSVHRELLGYDDEDLPGNTLAMHLGQVTADKIVDELSATGRHEGDYLSRTKSGTERRSHLSVFTVPEHGGQPLLFLVIQRDMDQTHPLELSSQSEYGVRELHEHLRRAQKMEIFGELAAGVAHDVNHLLMPIMGYAESEILDRPTDGVSRSVLAEILDSARRGRQLTSQLLAFARKQACSMQDVDLRDVVSESSTMLRSMLPASIDIGLDLPGELDTVRCDPSQIQQVMTNLATNAQEAMPDGGYLSIELRDVDVESDDPLARILGTTGSYVRVSVSDTGVGMDTHTLARAFEPFFSRKPAGEGSGLGLSIAYGIVTKHGGYIQAHSELGRGSSIRFYLPRTEDVCESIPVPSPPAMRPVHGSETVLVVEDEAPVRLLVVRLLQAQGYIVLAAENGEHAIKVAEQHDGPIHLLLTDVVMPGCDGRELYRQLIARRPDLLVLYITGYARMVVGDDGLDSGASILEKPFSAVELNEQVRSVLRVGRELA